ncbi:MAG: A/G-specific adenine glycosylase [Pseudomonadota bacterium]
MGKTFADDLLAWYDREARSLPWRIPPGGPLQDPYRVLVSEIMLQQTTVAVVQTRFVAFLDQFPDLFALARAPEADVLAAWAGLGYYRRARSLHACAKALVDDHSGEFPSTEEALKQLPGIGEYTAAAIASIAFGQPAVVVDGNIERVMARVHSIATPLPKGKKDIKAAAADVSPTDRPGDYAQALMDLGARICRPKAADCLLCPVRRHCRIQREGDPLALPVKAPRKAKQTVEGSIYVAVNGDDCVLCEDRPDDGLFAGMLGLPGGGWDGRTPPVSLHGGEVCGSFSHILTHRRLAIDVHRADAPSADQNFRWVPIDHARRTMPTLFRKALDQALSSDGS